jgi:hypothetical protein
MGDSFRKLTRVHGGKSLDDLQQLKQNVNPAWQKSSIWPLVAPLLDFFETGGPALESAILVFLPPSQRSHSVTKYGSI